MSYTDAGTGLPVGEDKYSDVGAISANLLRPRAYIYLYCLLVFCDGEGAPRKTQVEGAGTLLLEGV